MIKYCLICKNCQNSFDSWFSSSIEYEKLKKSNHINCYVCNSLEVEKNLMSPSIIRSKIKDSKDKKYIKIKDKIKEYQKFIKDNFNYVGDRFTYEARSIHYSKKKNEKGIYGSASDRDIKELEEEGIETQIIPWLKENDN